MDRAKVICHMMTTIDGKISIDWDGNGDYEAVGEKYDELVFSYGQAYGCGRGTFQYLEESSLDKFAGAKAEYKDKIIKPSAGQFLVVAFDRYGKLRWESNSMEYAGHDSLILEAVTEQVKPEFLAYLDSMGIPYLICGKESFDPETFLKKLKACYGVETFALCGGAGINAAFFEADLVDEISLMIGAAIDGTRDALTFVGGEKPFTVPKFYKLESMERIAENGVLLKYVK